MSSSNNNSQKKVYHDAFTKAASFAFAQVFPAILNAAIDMNLFDIISKAESSLGMSASEIASKIPKQHSEMGSRLERMLPSLVARSLLTCSIRTINEDGDTERVYAVSPVGQYYTSTHHDEQGCSWIALSTLFYRGYRHVWKDTKDAILDANNHNHFQRMYGKMAFEYMETDTELGNLFGKAMSQAGPLGVKSILDAYKGGFEGVSTLVDVGGGYGQVLKQILLQYPSIKGINFDLPHVVKNAPPRPGIEHIGGDMFESVPKGDAILIKHVCHNWGDEECVKFLRKCYEALPADGKVIVLETLVPEIPKSTSKDICAVDMDKGMFLVHGGKERTEKQYEKLCKRSGFSRFKVACNDSSAMDAVMEFYK
ncbi:isoliquiritigenin 2'-O-methyltransferase-like [Arachis stenosperma]|uniref:isoliquiritigenin 2'-O-methyltransferase-like n=1 Tax=Arachis stenosperma TaxID=217475 RepID=UPI0025ACC67C|nr:isoliquiritigenin 2'-O-methyltransferase-like [Arachis stenosperma]